MFPAACADTLPIVRICRRLYAHVRVVADDRASDGEKRKRNGPDGRQNLTKVRMSVKLTDRTRFYFLATQWR